MTCKSMIVHLHLRIDIPIPPRSKQFFFFVCGINVAGITRKIGSMVTEPTNFWRILFHGITAKFGWVSAQCEATWTGDEHG